MTSRFLALGLVFAWVVGCELNPQPDLPNHAGGGGLNTGATAAGGTTSASDAGAPASAEGGNGTAPSEGGSGFLPQGGFGNEAGEPAIEGGAGGESAGGAAGESALGVGGRD